ncbi:hypothetical protein CS8_005490 [Cupriavidus sp. 8B]
MRFCDETVAIRMQAPRTERAWVAGGSGTRAGALVFTAGVGEHAAPIREQVCRQAAWLGIALDAGANARGEPRISAPSSRVPVWVIPTNEELMIARHTRSVIGTEAL